ncbi:MAG: chorismate mutase [Oscillospiraceae bacterium]|nr:chorismate mutase [Oscillospiraceae bacterium]
MDLNELRNQIDSIDSDILELFAKRMEVCRKVAEYKKVNNLPVMQGGREKQIIERVRANSPEDLQDGAAMLFQNIMDISKCLQSAEIERNRGHFSPKPFKPEAAAKIACQGTVGAYSEAACKKLFGDKPAVFYHEFEDVFNAVESGEADYGILPLENSTIGTISETYSLMSRHSFNICSLVRVEITHCLAASECATLESVKRVYSKAEALSQCSEYIKTHGLVRREYANTALSAEYVLEKNDPEAACICSRSCAELYGLKILNDRIADAYPNYTRFICFSKDYVAPKNADTISVCMTVPNTPGSLYRMLTKFSIAGLNLTKIENKNIAGSDFEVLFYLDFKGSCADEKVVSLLHDLENEMTFFRFLGSFKEVL